MDSILYTIEISHFATPICQLNCSILKVLNPNIYSVKLDSQNTYYENAHT